VEASNAYRDDRAFFAEVYRVLVPKGAFLYADSRAPRKVPDLEGLAQETGLSGRFIDITDNVVRACELDSTRRRALIRTGFPGMAGCCSLGGSRTTPPFRGARSSRSSAGAIGSISWLA
jgi:hypothetical protein